MNWGKVLFMHELPVTGEILKTVLKHAKWNKVSKVVSVCLQIGKLSDLEDEWIQHYFDYLSKGTVAEGAKLKIERLPIVIQCQSCRLPHNVEASQLAEWTCFGCGGKQGELISGRQYYIKDMEVQSCERFD